eukprot:14729302-Ditylum_brightwellii.AAC.1
MPDLINRHALPSLLSTCSDENSIGIGKPATKEVDPEDGPNKVLSVNCLTAPPNTQEKLNRPLDSQAASDRLVEINTEIDEESLKDQYDSRATQQKQEQVHHCLHKETTDDFTEIA